MEWKRGKCTVQLTVWKYNKKSTKSMKIKLFEAKQNLIGQLCLQVLIFRPCPIYCPVKRS